MCYNYHNNQLAIIKQMRLKADPRSSWRKSESVQNVSEPVIWSREDWATL